MLPLSRQRHVYIMRPCGSTGVAFIVREKKKIAQRLPIQNAKQIN